MAEEGIMPLRHHARIEEQADGRRRMFRTALAVRLSKLAAVLGLRAMMDRRYSTATMVVVRYTCSCVAAEELRKVPLNVKYL